MVLAVQTDNTNDKHWQSEFVRLQRRMKKLERDYRALALLHDQTERMRDANETARELANFYTRLLLQRIPSIIFMFDSELELVLSSQTGVQFFGFHDMRELVGRSCRSIFSGIAPADWISGMEERCQQVMEQEKPLSFSENIRLSSGAELYFQVHLAPVIPPGNSRKGVIVVLEDISKLMRANAALEQANAYKSMFFANMSHEMRTPLHAVIGMTQMGTMASEASRKDYCFEQISGASNLLLGLINDVLDMSKIEAGKFELAPIAFRLNDLIDGVRNIIAIRADEKKQNFDIHIGESVPRALLGDDKRLAQVIVNLLSNAVKFTDNKGSIKLVVKRNPAQSEGSCVSGRCELLFEVSDTGIGISEEQQKRLFQPFTQANRDISRRFGGTGLGLAISRRIVELMGGHIWIKSVPEKGTTIFFTVSLEVDTNAVSSEHKPGETQQYDFSGRHVLLAEDIAINREIACTLFEAEGLKVDCACNGREAVDMFAANPGKYSIIFMDIKMPKMDGLEATMLIRRLPSAEAKLIPIVAMSANVFQEDIKHYLASGMNAHIGKPFAMEQVLQVLRQTLSV